MYIVSRFYHNYNIYIIIIIGVHITSVMAYLRRIFYGVIPKLYNHNSERSDSYKPSLA